MTAYNREKYIGEAIESVLNSTYENFELIIVDDCSKDTTVEIIKCYEAKDARIKFYLNEKNLGDYANRNKAAGYASGKYIKYCDSDDKLYNWTLDYCVTMMEKYPEAGMAILNLNKNIPQEYMTSAEAIHFNFFQTEILAIGPSGTILRSEAFKKAGFFKPDYSAASDMYFNIKMASLFPIVLLNEDFFFYREHEGQEFQNKYGYLCYSYKYLHDALQLPEIPLTAGQKNKLLTQAKRSFVKRFFKYLKVTGNLGKAQKAFNISGIGIAGFLRGIFQ
jgi:glycosyltransferase involved in cell wall biosynthesis